MNYSIKFTKQAIDDLESFKIYYNYDRNKYQKLIDEIDKKNELLSIFPRQGEKIDNDLPLNGEDRYIFTDNFVMFYRIYDETQTIFIFGVKSQRQDWLKSINLKNIY